LDRSITKSKPGGEIVEGLEGGVPEAKIVCASTIKEVDTDNHKGAEAKLRKWLIDKDACSDRGIKLEGTMENYERNGSWKVVINKMARSEPEMVRW